MYNSECVFTFDTPFSPRGLFVSLTNWQGVGADHLAFHAERSGSPLYLHIKKMRVPKPVDPAADPSSLNDLLQASLHRFDVRVEMRVVAATAPSEGIAFPSDDLPMSISEVAGAVAAHTSAGDAEEAATAVAEEEVIESKYAEALPWLENGVKISPDPSTWECAESGLKENLWLNLSTGHIGSGRRQWDGSGGADGAVNHFTKTGSKYPLVVKLGTISPAGADVYSYAPDEDCMVKDPRLAEHLARWGINIM